MLFNSFDFIFLFLPVAIIGFAVTTKFGHRMTMLWLIVASLFFYGIWQPAYVLLLLISVIINFAAGQILVVRKSRVILAASITANLILIGYYKYADFFQSIINQTAGTEFSAFNEIILPLAISFFTFQQIAFLVDSYRNEVRAHNFIEYALFVTFFPQLIAGPIVHQRQVLPQFQSEIFTKLRARNIAVGSAIFAIGLFKKVFIADTFATYADPVFAASAAGTQIHIVEAWGAALAFSFQIYFDFSGYTDMALGLARMFGILLPYNFNSPYKACSIIEFWRRWHMTLSRFLRDYLYIPLGGSRHGGIRSAINVIIVMGLGGLWHGAAWTFVAWGALHGLFIIANRSWRYAMPANIANFFRHAPQGRAMAWTTTMLCLVVSWVYFRAESFESANSILAAMLGLGQSFTISETYFTTLLHHFPAAAPFVGLFGIPIYSGPDLFSEGIVKLAMLLILSTLIVTVLPNSQQLILRASGHNGMAPLMKWASLDKWRPNLAWAIATGCLLGLGFREFSGAEEFIYFQF